MMRSSVRWTVFFISIALFCFLQCDTKHTGITNSTPKLQSPRLNVRGISLLTVSAGLLMRPKRSLALSPVVSTAVTTNAASIISSSVVVAVKDEESIVNGLISGAATRVSKELLLHPIDTVRARLQRAPNYVEVDNNQQNDGLFDNLYDGLLPALIGGVPAGALFFGIKDYSKKKLRKMGLGKQESTVLSVMAANVPYWLIRTPSEVLKTRRQIGYDNSSSIGEMMGKMVEEEGGIIPAIQSTYGSYASNFVYALPADIVKFVAYETLTSAVLGVKEGQKIEGFQAAVTGAAAGLIAQALTTPLDVARTRIMSRSTSSDLDSNANEGVEGKGDLKKPTNNPITELVNIVEGEGVGTLFAGLLPRATRALASGAIQFGTYELTQNSLLNR